ncbi:MAG: hypothetical protein OEW04_12385, partial [Nitrospirota bacterium]|nr:hypothetical protein [Nitrospirota bacterium]
MTKRIRLLLIFFLSAAACIAVFSFPAIPQDPAYHNFADRRAVLGAANFLDVISNLPFVFVGIYGLYVLRRLWKKDTRNSFIKENGMWPYV